VAANERATRRTLEVRYEIREIVDADVRARHVVDLFHKLRTDRERNLAQGVHLQH
jgi:hypothetical protein